MWISQHDQGSSYGYIVCAECGHRPFGPITSDIECPVCAPAKKLEKALVKACKVFIEEMEKR